jgi:hypothetical protein
MAGFLLKTLILRHLHSFFCTDPEGGDVYPEMLH